MFKRLISDELLPPANEVREGYVFTGPQGWGVSAPLHAGIHTSWAGTPPHAGTPPWVDPPGRYTTPWAGAPSTPPRQVHPLSRYTPWAGTPPSRYPPARCMLGYTPPAQCMLTGMHSCLEKSSEIHLASIFNKEQIQMYSGPTHKIVLEMHVVTFC